MMKRFVGFVGVLGKISRKARQDAKKDADRNKSKRKDKGIF